MDEVAIDFIHRPSSIVHRPSVGGVTPLCISIGHLVLLPPMPVMDLKAGHTQRTNAEQATLMDAQFDWLNRQIDNLQAGKSLLRGRAPDEYEPSAEDVEMLRFAAGLNAVHVGLAIPEAGFVSGLRERVLASVESS